MGNLRSATGNEGCGSGRLVSITSKGKETARTTIISHLEYFLHSGSNIEIEFFAVIVAGSLPTFPVLYDRLHWVSLGLYGWCRRLCSHSQVV